MAKKAKTETVETEVTPEIETPKRKLAVSNRNIARYGEMGLTIVDNDDGTCTVSRGEDVLHENISISRCLSANHMKDLLIGLGQLDIDFKFKKHITPPKSYRERLDQAAEEATRNTLLQTAKNMIESGMAMKIVEAVIPADVLALLEIEED